MARTKIIIEQETLEAAIQEAEKDGPLTNQSVLWKEVARIYNEKTGQNISHSVVYLRVKEWNIEVKTEPGKKRRSGPQMSQQDDIPLKTASKADLRTAIKKCCINCCGGDKKEVAHCRVENCALHPYRPYIATPEEIQQEEADNVEAEQVA